MIKYGSDEKDEGYDRRDVGNSCLLLDVSFEIVLAEGRKTNKKVEVKRCIHKIDKGFLVHAQTANTLENNKSTDQDTCS